MAVECHLDIVKPGDKNYWILYMKDMMQTFGNLLMAEFYLFFSNCIQKKDTKNVKFGYVHTKAEDWNIRTAAISVLIR